MAPTIAAVMAGIETRLNTITGLRATDVTPDQVNVSGNASVAIVGVPDIPDYRIAMQAGSMRLSFQVTVLVSAAMDRVGQLRLAGFANPTGGTSVITAIEADKTLGGVVDQCWVTDFRPLGMEEVGVIGYYGGVFTVHVVADGN